MRTKTANVQFNERCGAHMLDRSFRVCVHKTVCKQELTGGHRRSQESPEVTGVTGGEGPNLVIRPKPLRSRGRTDTKVNEEQVEVIRPDDQTKEETCGGVKTFGRV